MEPLWKLLGVTQGLTAVIGSGGKTSLLYELAECCWPPPPTS